MTNAVTSPWRPEHLARLSDRPGDAPPVIRPGDLVRMSADHDVWDIGPVRTPAGALAEAGGAGLWLALSAPARGDPADRHDIARLRLFARRGGGWDDLGPLFPEGAARGSREWAGSATLDGDRLEVLYTAAGGRDPGAPHYDQRIVATTARLSRRGDAIAWGDWTPHREVLAADGRIYAPTDGPGGEPGFIRAFRDPFPVRDPADGADWVLFAGSLAGARSRFDGAVGLARADGDGGYRLAPPLIAADGVNTELERPHLVVHGGRYHLLFSTQARTFAPGLDAPTGLYGFVAPALRGPYRPINGSGLVLRNPPGEPSQAYSWMVLPDLRVVAFVDAYDLGGRSAEELAAAGPQEARRHFGGTIAPLQRIRLDGDRAGLATAGTVAR
ncbi:MAG: glycoside hydrolase family 68 protein [Thermoleophilia bacterium]